MIDPVCKWLFWALCPLAALAGDQEEEVRNFARAGRPFLQQYCTGCHGGDRPKASLDLERFGDDHLMFRQRDLWESVRHMLVEREMPPENKPQPTEEQRIRFVQFINEELARFDCDEIRRPGRVTLRRMNRAEYNNTIRDLVGIDFEPAADFPLDEVGYGFDNIGDVLSLSPILMENYLNAAERIVESAFLAEIPRWPPVRRMEAEAFTSHNEPHVRAEDGVMGFHREGTASRLLQVESTGEYLLSIRAWGDQAGPDPARLTVQLDRDEEQVVDVGARRGSARIYTLRLTLDEGPHRLTLGYPNNYNVQDHPLEERNGDRNLFVDHVELEGPLDRPAPPLPGTHTRLFGETPEPGRELESARRILTPFVLRAWRRPPDPGQIERLLSLVEAALERHSSFEEAVGVAVKAILASPRFLYRWEAGPGEIPVEGGERPLDAWELASRLSYFLWSSMPDDTLFSLAESGALQQPGTLAAQVRRMIADPRADALVSNFAGQWLQFRNLDTVTPDPETFPAFDETLRRAMRRESELFFAAVMREDRSLLDLLDADFTFVNDRLAAHYGIEGDFGEEFVRIELGEESVRGGILTQASTLALTSNPTRTSPVIRGKWVLDQILGTPPPPPPPDIPELEEGDEAIAAATLRERLEHHRAKPECATCHAKMDPIGFAFENFDAIGTWRELDGTFPIDPSGELPDGRRFDGPAELVAILRREETFVRTVTEKMLTFALGRGLEYFDSCAVDDIVESVKRSEYRFSTLITGIVTSDPFLKVSVDPAQP